MKRVYLDYAAATPVAREVLEAMQPYFSDDFGNPGSLHYYGQRAEAALDRAREIVAKEVGVDFGEVIFTASATEANNLLLRGLARKVFLSGAKPRLIISEIEHESVLETCRELEVEGAELVRLPVSRDGFVDPSALEAVLTPETTLVSVIYASHEIGTIQPVRSLARLVRDFREKRGSLYPIFHTDAVQGFQFDRLDLADLGVDALTLSSQKIYGPKGAGALILKAEYLPLLSPIITGGTQEFGRRAGTPNVPAIVGFGEAVSLVAARRQKEAERLRQLRDDFWQELKNSLPQIELNGSLADRLPNNLNIYFPGQNSQTLLVKLDQAGLAASAGSACSVRRALPSHVILALGFAEERARSSLRFSLGWPVEERDLRWAAEIIRKALT
jgi:cysteine desulfurase